MESHEFERADHAIASQLGVKHKSNGTSVVPDELKSILYSADTPTTLTEFLQADCPCLGLHIVQFTDSTMVTINWPHVLLDTMALADILHAWTLLLNGHTDKIPMPSCFDSDPLASLGVSHATPHDLANHQLSLPSLVSFGVRSALRFLRSKIEHRMIYVPAWYLQSIRETALWDLNMMEPGQSVPFLSDGDLLCAWWARHSVRHLDKQKHHGKTVVISNAMSIRPVLEKDVLPPCRPFIANSTAIITTLMKLEDIIDQPPMNAASKVRDSIIKLRSREQVEAYAALQRSSWKRVAPLFGDHKMHGIMVSNWSKAKLFDMDFSGALFDMAETRLEQPRSRVKPAFIQSHFAGGDFVEVVVVIGKDADGGYWLNCSTNANRWQAIAAALADELKSPMTRPST